MNRGIFSSSQIGFQLTRTVLPTIEPVTLDEFKEQARVLINDEDALLSRLLMTARQAVENALGRALITQTWQLQLDRFPAWRIPLPRPPLVEVSSIVYLDVNAAQQTLSTSIYQVAGVGGEHMEPGYIVPAYGKYYPPTRPIPQAVTIVYVAGVPTRGEVPEPVRAEILRLAGWMYENREADGGQLPLSQSFALEFGCPWEPEYQ